MRAANAIRKEYHLQSPLPGGSTDVEVSEQRRAEHALLLVPWSAGPAQNGAHCCGEGRGSSEEGTVWRSQGKVAFLSQGSLPQTLQK